MSWKCDGFPLCMRSHFTACGINFNVLIQTSAKQSLSVCSNASLTLPQDHLLFPLPCLPSGTRSHVWFSLARKNKQRTVLGQWAECTNYSDFNRQNDSRRSKNEKIDKKMIHSAWTFLHCAPTTSLGHKQSVAVSLLFFFNKPIKVWHAFAYCPLPLSQYMSL